MASRKLCVFWLNFFPPLQVCPSPEKPALQEQRYDPRVFLQSAFTSQTLTEALHSPESVKEYPNRLERQYKLIMMHNFKQTIVQFLFNQVIHRLKKTQVCVKQFYRAGSPRVSMFIIPITYWIVAWCWELKRGINNEFTLHSRMQMSQDLSNPTLKKIYSYEYAILSVIYSRNGWDTKYIDKIKDKIGKKCAMFLNAQALIRGWCD